jgi:hypothetical protein
MTDKSYVGTDLSRVIEENHEALPLNTISGPNTIRTENLSQNKLATGAVLLQRKVLAHEHCRRRSEICCLCIKRVHCQQRHYSFH